MKEQHIGRWLRGFSLLLICSMTHAESGCPAGMIPYNGTDISSCGPIPPGYNQPQGHWLSRWAAFAKGENLIAGFASDQPSEEAAKQTSIDNCMARGGIQCAVKVTYNNGCIAVVRGTDEAGEPQSTVATAGTLKGAVKEGIKVCKTWGKDSCKVFRTACGLPEWISN